MFSGNKFHGGNIEKKLKYLWECAGMHFTKSNCVHTFNSIYLYNENSKGIK